MSASVRYDGPSRPIVVTTSTPPRMFSISEFVDGKWNPFEDEDLMCELLAQKINERGL